MRYIYIYLCSMLHIQCLYFGRVTMISNCRLINSIYLSECRHKCTLLVWSKLWAHWATKMSIKFWIISVVSIWNILWIQSVNSPQPSFMNTKFWIVFVFAFFFFYFGVEILCETFLSISSRLTWCALGCSADRSLNSRIFLSELSRLSVNRNNHFKNFENCQIISFC